MSARFRGVGGLNQNAGTADAGEVSDQMLTLLTLGSGRMEMSGLIIAEIKRK